MKPGTKPKPIELRLLQGNPGKRRIPDEDERPRVKHEKPIAPPNLPREARILWRELVKLLDEMGVLAKSDRRALEMLCRAYADYLDARVELDRDGLTFKTENRLGDVMIKKHPAVEIANAAHAQVCRLLAEFGLTPSARTRVAPTGAKADPLGDYLGRRK